MSVKTLSKKHKPYSDLLSEDEDPFSTNKVTGHSLNVPIIGTCQPTVVCADTCYFAAGPSTWTASLRKQHRLMNSIKADPRGVAERIVKSARRKKMTFIRWNGGGDLFEESVACLDAVAVAMPDIPQWVVSRIPKIAAQVTPRPNVYLHFSVDRSSWARLEEFRGLAPAGLQWFWSYQCDKDEQPASGDIAPVIFRDGYDPKGSPLFGNDCPLNSNEDITNVCEGCRRCFNGGAVERAKECRGLSTRRGTSSQETCTSESAKQLDLTFTSTSAADRSCETRSESTDEITSSGRRSSKSRRQRRPT